MPTYEYHCSKCDGTFDIVQPMAAKPLTECPKDHCCQKKWGHGKVKRSIGAGAGLIFKGSGFYITDYRSENYKAAAKKESSGSSEGTKTTPEKKSSGGATGTGSTGTSSSGSTSSKKAA